MSKRLIFYSIVVLSTTLVLWVVLRVSTGREESLPTIDGVETEKSTPQNSEETSAGSQRIVRSEESHPRMAASKADSLRPPTSENFRHQGDEEWPNAIYRQRGIQKREGPTVDQIRKLIDTVLNVTDQEMRMNAIETLSYLERNPEVADALLTVIKNSTDSDEIRIRAIRVYPFLGDPAGISTLMEIAENDPSFEIREATAGTLDYIRAVSSGVSRLSRDNSQ